MLNLKVGDQAPLFTLPSASGKQISLETFKGKKVILYFYPKDNTPGCSQQACDFRDKIEDFSNLNAVILGVSKDSLKSHERFIGKFDLPFELLSDEDCKMQETYGVWQLKKNYGKEYMGTVRSTFVINEEGVIEKIYSKVRVKGHIEKVLEDLK